MGQLPRNPPGVCNVQCLPRGDAHPGDYDKNAFIPRLYDPSWQVLECDGQSAHHPGLRDVRPSASPPDERTSLLASGGTKKHSYSLTFEKHHGNLSGNYDNWVQVTTKKPIALCGIILRSQLITLLKRKVFFDEKSAVVVSSHTNICSTCCWHAWSHLLESL